MKSKSYLPYILAGAAGAIVSAFVPLLLSHSQAETMAPAAPARM